MTPPVPSLRVVATTPEPDRTRLLVLVSAWWTVAQMESTGTPFGEFLQSALVGSARAGPMWTELTRRLQAMAADQLQLYPEAALTPEARTFIEGIVDTMGRRSAVTNEDA